jgi:putative NADPH-quinone reductase
MTTLVVQAHPLDDSYNAALLARVQEGLRVSGRPFDTLQLAHNPESNPARLNGVTRLVLVYPTWWGGLPASMLSWVQAMLAADAFGSVQGIQAVTSHGSDKVVNFVQGAWGRRYLRTRVAKACQPGTKVAWHALYKIDRCTSADLEDFLASTEQLFTTKS